MREAAYVLAGNVQLNDAYLGRERCGGTAGRGYENKLPFVAAVSIGSQGHPLRAKLSPVDSFTSDAIGEWAEASLASSCSCISRVGLLS